MKNKLNQLHAEGMRTQITNIVVEGRVRKDLGDLTSLKESMQRPAGLLVPLGVICRRQGERTECVLVHGKRRLEAARQLGWTEIDVRVLETVDDLQRLLAERDENVERKDLTLSERAEFAKLLEPLEKEAARARQSEGGRHGGEGSGNLPEPSKGEAKEKIAKAVGLSRHTLEKAQEVAAAAAAEPEKYADLKSEMDRTSKVSKPHAQLRKRRRQEAQPEPPDPQAEPSPAGVNEEIVQVAEGALKQLVELNGKRDGAPLSDEARKGLTRLVHFIARRLLGDEEATR